MRLPNLYVRVQGDAHACELRFGLIIQDIVMIILQRLHLVKDVMKHVGSPFEGDLIHRSIFIVQRQVYLTGVQRA